VIMLFQDQKTRWMDRIEAHATVCMGEEIGTIC
jgi:hypothetical protein